MQKLVMLAAVLCCLSTSAHAAGQPTVKDIVGYASDGNKEFAALITGVGRGVEGANMILGFRKQEELYCQPNIAVTGDQYLRIMEIHIERHPDQAALDPAMVGIVMTMALREAFPCK